MFCFPTEWNRLEISEILQERPLIYLFLQPSLQGIIVGKTANNKRHV